MAKRLFLPLLAAALLVIVVGEASCQTSDECCGVGFVSLSSAQLKTRLEHFVPISPPAMRGQFQIRSILTFRVGIDRKGTVRCIRLISGHPLIVGSAFDALKQWTFKPVVIDGRAKPSCGLLILRVAANEFRVEATILDEAPKKNDRWNDFMLPGPGSCTPASTVCCRRVRRFLTAVASRSCARAYIS